MPGSISGNSIAPIPSEIANENEIDIEMGARRSSQINNDDDEKKSSGPNSSSETLEDGDIEEYTEPKHEPIKHTQSNLASRVLSRISTKKSWVDPGPPPDGGFKAWLQCAMGCLIVTTTWGFINSFGMFQSFYIDFLNRPPSDIAWIGSIQVFLLFFLGTFSGRLTDAGYFRHVFAFGSFMQLLGIFMASISTQYWQFILAQGICVGIGNGCMFCPGVAIVSTYFSKKKSLAIGISASGSAVGGMIFPVMVQKLLPQIGFGWTMRCLGLVDAMFLLTVNLCMRPRVPPRKGGQIFDLASFKDMTYTFFGIGMFFTFWGVYFAFFFLSAFARAELGFGQAESINLILILNGVGIPGRVIPNHLADRFFGPLNLLVIASGLGGVIVYCMMAVNSKPGVYVWAVGYGLLGAAVQSLFPAVLGSLASHDLSKAGVKIGMIFSIVSFAVLTGPPIAGQLVVVGDGSYTYAMAFAATSIMIGCSFKAMARFKSTGFVLKEKV